MLGLVMTWYILFDIISLVRLSICWLCLFLMFVESALAFAWAACSTKPSTAKRKTAPAEYATLNPSEGLSGEDLL